MSEHIRRSEIEQEGVVPCVLLQTAVARGETVCEPHHSRGCMEHGLDCGFCGAIV